VIIIFEGLRFPFWEKDTIVFGGLKGRDFSGIFGQRNCVKLRDIAKTAKWPERD
jgi:hypothetical protein